MPHFNRGLPAVRDMTLKRGPVSGLRLFRGKAVLVEGELTGQGGYTGSAGWVTRVRWNGEPLDPQVFLQRWLGARVPHHIALGQGRLGQPLREALAWAGVDLAEPEGRYGVHLGSRLGLPRLPLLPGELATYTRSKPS